MPPKYQGLTSSCAVTQKGSSPGPIPLSCLSVWVSHPIRYTYVSALVLRYVYKVLPVPYKLAVVFLRALYSDKYFVNHRPETSILFENRKRKCLKF